MNFNQETINGREVHKPVVWNIVVSMDRRHIREENNLLICIETCNSDLPQ